MLQEKQMQGRWDSSVGESRRQLQEVGAYCQTSACRAQARRVGLRPRQQDRGLMACKAHLLRQAKQGEKCRNNCVCVVCINCSEALVERFSRHDFITVAICWLVTRQSLLQLQNMLFCW